MNNKKMPSHLIVLKPKMKINLFPFKLMSHCVSIRSLVSGLLVKYVWSSECKRSARDNDVQPTEDGHGT